MFFTDNNAYVLRVPKLNLQVIVLALIALITIFQTIQLLRISSKAGTIKAITVPSGAGTGTESGGDAPASMVGGC